MGEVIDLAARRKQPSAAGPAKELAATPPPNQKPAAGVADMFEAVDGGWRTSEKGNKYLNLTLRSTGVNYNTVIFERAGVFRWRVVRASDQATWWGKTWHATQKAAYGEAWETVLVREAIGDGTPPPAA
jgi:hypothetical protein